LKGSSQKKCFTLDRRAIRQRAEQRFSAQRMAGDL